MLNIKVITVGHVPRFNKKKIEKWKSKLFKINGNIENYTLPNDSDGYNWEFTDENLKTIIPNNNIESGFTIAIVNGSLEQDYYSRIINDNLVVISFYPIQQFLEDQNIPLENVVLRLIYAYCLGYLSSNEQISNNISIRSFTHDETRGCLYDMTGIERDVVYSCHNPIICSDCLEKMKKNRVSIDKLNIAQNEIKKIKKELFYNLIDIFKKHPVASFIIITILTSIISDVTKFISNIIIELIKS